MTTVKKKMVAVARVIIVLLDVNVMVVVNGA